MTSARRRLVAVPSHLLSDHGSPLAALDAVEVVTVADPRAAAAADAVYVSAESISGDEAGAVVAATRSRELSWVHIGWAGSDHPWVRGFVDRGVTVTAARGAGAAAVAHHAIAGWLAIDKGLLRAVHRQRDRNWVTAEGVDLEARRVTVVGLGPIGLEISRLCEAFGAAVTGVTRSSRLGADRPVEPLSSLVEVAARTDVLISVLPLTPETTGLFSRSVFDALPNGSVFVNVGRGGLVDEDALVDHLRSGNLAGAALDVFAVEPLPEDHPLWALPNVLVTPHVAGRTAGTNRRADDTFIANLERWAVGAPLADVVE